jgi:hypothetical protein
VNEVRDHKFAVEKWVNAQPTLPSRKDVVAQFPNTPHRIIKSVLQSRKDREATK